MTDPIIAACRIEYTTIAMKLSNLETETISRCSPFLKVTFLLLINHWAVGLKIFALNVDSGIPFSYGGNLHEAKLDLEPLDPPRPPTVSISSTSQLCLVIPTTL